MKISLTFSEIKALVAEKYSLKEFELEIVESPKFEEDPDGWISNVGRDCYGHPKSLSPNTQIEVKFRSGETDTGIARAWHITWRESDNASSDIVAYRILK